MLTYGGCGVVPRDLPDKKEAEIKPSDFSLKNIICV